MQQQRTSAQWCARNVTNYVTDHGTLDGCRVLLVDLENGIEPVAFCKNIKEENCAIASYCFWKLLHS